MIRPRFTVGQCNISALRVSVLATFYSFTCPLPTLALSVSLTITHPAHISPSWTPLTSSFPRFYLRWPRCSSLSQNLTAALRKKRKKKTNPPSSSCSHASQVGLSIPLLYLPGPVFHRNVFLVCLTSSPCLMHWQIYSDWRRELGLKWKVSAE